ncbi:type II toxin-antitoxin system VapC family toxin [Corticibacterium sp. UT-5YL-CI-8]|nr:type II toxin-antitoxin system VapC family toxin [Tianweitania sp. UT-5YL-CI-8]
MIVLDTNIISEPTKPSPNATVLAWLNAQAKTSLFLTAPGMAEMWAGARRVFLRDGSARYAKSFERVAAAYADRILVFDFLAAKHFGDIVAQRERFGRPMALIDAMIAAICIAHGAVLATRNLRDFDGLDLKLVNPFEAHL